MLLKQPGYNVLKQGSHTSVLFPIGNPSSLNVHEENRIQQAPFESALSDTCPELNNSPCLTGPNTSESALDLPLYSSTHSLIQQETGDPSLSQQHFSISASHESLRKSYDYIRSSTPKSTHPSYHFVDSEEYSQRTRSQETSHSELNLIDYSTGITSSEYSSSLSHKPSVTSLNPPFRGSNSSSISEHLSSSAYHTSRPNVIRKTASNSGVLAENYLGQHDSNKRETVTVTHSTKCEDAVDEPHDQTSDNSGQTSGDLFRPQVIAAVSRVHNTQSVNDKRQPDHEAANLASCVQVIDSTSQSSGSDVTPTVPSQVVTPIQTEGMHNVYGMNVSEPSVVNNNYFLPYTIANAHIIMHDDIYINQRLSEFTNYISWLLIIISSKNP